LRTVKKNRGKVLREITNDFNEGGVVRVHPKAIQRYLHKNKIFRRVVRKKMVVREVNKKKRLSMADTCTRGGKPHSKISTRTHGYFVQ
jgi:hypothetical protein